MSSRDQLRETHTTAMARLDALAEQWLDLRAAGRSTQTANDRWRECERETRKLERKLRRISKRTGGRAWAHA